MVGTRALCNMHLQANFFSMIIEQSEAEESCDLLKCWGMLAQTDSVKGLVEFKKDFFISVSRRYGLTH